MAKNIVSWDGSAPPSPSSLRVVHSLLETSAKFALAHSLFAVPRLIGAVLVSVSMKFSHVQLHVVSLSRLCTGTRSVEAVSRLHKLYWDSISSLRYAVCLFMSSNKRCYHFLWRLRRKILRNRTIRRVQRWWKWSRPSYLPARLRAKISDARKLEKLAKDALKSYSFPLWQWNSPYWVLQQQPREFPPLWERMLCTSRPEILILPNWATPLVFWEVLFHGHNRTGRQIYSKENYDATRTLRDESIRKNGIPQLLFATTELKSSGDNTVIMIKIWGISQQCNSGRE